MGNFEDLLIGLADADASRFAGGGFADDRLGAVAGAVRRRRAARAAGVGGVSVVGASALAVGAVNLPGISVGFGFAPATGTVVCTTTEPGAVVAKPLVFPEGATQVVIDDATNTAYFIGGTVESPLAWAMNGTKVRFEASGGLTQLVLDSGARVTILLEEGAGVGAHVPAGVTWMTPAEFEDFVTPGSPSSDPNGSQLPGAQEFTVESWLLYQDGIQVAKVDDDGTTLGVMYMSGDYETFVTLENERTDFEGIEDDLALPDGNTAHFTFDGTTLTVAGSGGPAASPKVDCVTGSPEPSGESSNSPVASVSPSPAASPDMVSGLLGSPFLCGFEFPSEQGTTGVVTIGETTWVSADDAVAAIEALYADPDSVSVVTSGDAVPVTKVTWAEDWRGRVLGGSTGWLDPASVNADHGSDNVSEGAAYVRALDGIVIATYRPSSGDTTQYVATDEQLNLDVFGTDLVTDMNPCEGVDVASLEAAQVVAVAGTALFESSGATEGPYYAWKYIDQP